MSALFGAMLNKRKVAVMADVIDTLARNATFSSVEAPPPPASEEAVRSAEVHASRAQAAALESDHCATDWRQRLLDVMFSAILIVVAVGWASLLVFGVVCILRLCA